jgi:hypothetical protein
MPAFRRDLAPGDGGVTLIENGDVERRGLADVELSANPACQHADLSRIGVKIPILSAGGRIDHAAVEAGFQGRRIVRVERLRARGGDQNGEQKAMFIHFFSPSALVAQHGRKRRQTFLDCRASPKAVR